MSLARRSCPRRPLPKRPRDRAYPGATLAHPVTQPFNLPVSPLEAASAAAGLVLAVAFAAPAARIGANDRPDRLFASWAGTLSAWQLVTRLAAVALLGLAVAAGRLGVDSELENLASALIVGAAWPLLVLVSIALGPVWRWTDPWDLVARAFTQGQSSAEPGHVWPAAAIALPWVWYLSAYQDPLDPKSVGAMLALYTLLTLGGCLALGRVRWLGTCEPLGIVLSWMALLPRRRLADWDPPRGAEALLGVLAGGVLFGAVRRSELWGDLNTVQHADLVAAAGLAAFCAVAAGLLTLVAFSGEAAAARAAAARAAVPAAAGIILAVALDRNRLFTSVQLLPELLGDPFGRGWDPFGRAGSRLDPAPLGAEGLQWAQIATLVLGHVVGALAGARRLERRARGPVALGLAILVGASVIAVASH